MILRPGFIHGTRRVGSVKIPLGLVGSPMQMVMFLSPFFFQFIYKISEALLLWVICIFWFSAIGSDVAATMHLRSVVIDPFPWFCVFFSCIMQWRIKLN